MGKTDEHTHTGFDDVTISVRTSRFQATTCLWAADYDRVPFPEPPSWFQGNVVAPQQSPAVLSPCAGSLRYHLLYAEPTDPLRVATNTWPGYQPLYLAQDLGYLKGVDLHEMPSSSPVIRAFRNRSVDIAALTLDEVLPLVQDGVHAHVILVTDFSHGGDVLLAGPSVATLQDLKGKRIGVENTALGAYMLTRALQHAGLAVNDIRIVPRTVDLHAGAFLSGDVDAVVTFEPVSTRLLKEGARILFDSSMIPGEILDVLVAHDDVLQRRPRAVDDLLEAWYRALDDMSQDPKEAFGKMARHMDAVNARDIENSMKGLTIPRRRENRQLLEGTEPQIIPVAERLMQVMLANGLLKRPVDLPSLLPGAPMKTDSP